MSCGDAGVPGCDEAACGGAGGSCSEDGTSCLLPACSSDADCESGQPGAFCENPGDVELATCRAPAPEEIVAPVETEGWSGFRVTDTSGELLADASTESQVVTDIPADGAVRVYADYDGADTTAYVQIQSGGQACPNFPPRTDYVAVAIVDGKISTPEADYLQVALHGGYQRIQLSTTDVPGQGERSFVVELGEPCAPPAHAFTAILTWDAGPGQPADLDLNVWNEAGELVFVGTKQRAWGQLRDARGPGPEVFESDDASQGPFTIKVQFFSGKPREIEAKVRVIRTVDGQLRDTTYVVDVGRPKDVAEVGVFAAE